MPRISVVEAGGRNVCAFLDMLAESEGTARVPGSDDGYNVVVGGATFQGYADHPRKLVHLRADLASTAAGRYQLLARYFDAYKKLLGLPDFSPRSQDLIAIQQIRERGALKLIRAGRFDDAVAACANIWASLPGAGYHQHENSLSTLAAAYTAAGGLRQIA
jgi:muramidase (phage lysozyme)